MELKKIFNKMDNIIKEEEAKYEFSIMSTHIFLVSKNVWNSIRREWGGDKSILELRYHGYSMFIDNILNDDIIFFGKLYSIV